RPQVAMQLRVALADRLQVRAVELGGRDLAALEQRNRALGGQSQRVDHAVGGTRKWSPSRSGAFAKTSSSESDGRGSSSSQTLTRIEGSEGRRARARSMRAA